MNTFSAKDLLTRSCMQIKMFAEHPERKPQPSSMMMYGEKFQRAVADTIQGVIGEEMRGSYKCIGYDIAINFSNDIVCNDKIIEVKSVTGEAPAWYLESSLLQCALYKSLILCGANDLVTASFYANLGNERKHAHFGPFDRFRYILIFGEEKYEVNVYDPWQIVGFFEYKASCCTGTWDLAKNWDLRYKHREFECLKRFFGFKQIF